MTDVIKLILPPNSRGTIRQTMLRYYVPPQEQQFQVQSSENDFVPKEGSKDYGFWSAYRQLFLFAMRHFCGLTDSHPLGFSQVSRTRCLDRSELWERLKLLMNKVGFVLPGPRSRAPTNSAEFVAIRALLKRLRPPELFVYEESNLSEWSTKIASVLCSMAPRVVTAPVPVQSWDKIEEWCLEQRCGMTDTETLFLDQKYLFLENIYSIDEPARETMTSFAVKRNTFRSFFPDFYEDTERDIRPDQAGTVPVPTELTMYSHGARNSPIIPQQNATLPVEPLIHLQAAVGGPAPSRRESSVGVQESQTASLNWQSPLACKCIINMTPDNFYASCRPFLPNLDGVLFFDMATHEILCFRPSAAVEFHSLIDNVDHRWYAKVMDETFALKTLAPTEVITQCESGGCIIFHGEESKDFKSTLVPTVTNHEISLPYFDPVKSQWTLQSR